MTTMQANHEVLTAERALELLREVVAEAGANFVYQAPGPHCVYVHDGDCSCLVGRALHLAGAAVDDLVEVNEVSIAGVAQVGALVLDDEARTVLNAAQVLQDEGLPWGAALQAAADVFDGLEFCESLGGAA